MGFFTVVVWLVLSFLIANGAKGRGKSWGGYLALSILLSPLVGFIALMVSPPPQTSKSED